MGAGVSNHSPRKKNGMRRRSRRPTQAEIDYLAGGEQPPHAEDLTGEQLRFDLPPSDMQLTPTGTRGKQHRKARTPYESD